MKVLSLALLLMASLAFVLLGCSDTNTQMVAPNGTGIPLATSASILGKGAVVHSASGNCNVFFEGKMSPLTFNAELHQDGTVTGQFNLLITSFKIHAHGPVVALQVYENYTFENEVSGRTAVICYREEAFEPLIGKYIVFFVVDVGEGNKAVGPDWSGPTCGPFDEITLMDPQAIADTAPDSFVPLPMGNVQVH